MENQVKTRRYEFDWLRVLAFSLLIFYHTGMFFVGWEWHIKNNELSETMELPMLFLSQWRMSLIFIVSGVGVYFALGYRSVGTFAQDRLKRVLVPLLAGMLLIVPPQVYLERLTQGYSGSYLHFLPSIFKLEPYPEGNFSWHHLWYLAYIFTYSLLLLPVLLYLRRTAWKLEKVKGWVLLLLPAIWFSLGALFLSEHFPGTNDLVHDWSNHFIYLSMFLFGFMLMKAPALQHHIRSLRWYSLVAATATICWLYIGFWLPGGDISGTELTVYFVLKSCNRWFWLMSILGFAMQHLNIRSRHLAAANEMVYPFYILHQTVIVAVAYMLMESPWPIAVKFTVIAVATFVICFLVIRYLIMPFNFLRIPFGLKPKAKPAPILKEIPVTQQAA